MSSAVEELQAGSERIIDRVGNAKDAIATI